MALVKCHECGNEISTEAKVCPQCGAKNKKHKKSKIITFGGAFLIFFGLFIVYLIFEHELNLNIPTCESAHGKKVFVNLVEKTPWVRENMIKVIDVLEQKEISSGSRPDERICEVTFRLSNSKNKTYIFSFEDKENGGYIAKTRPK